MSLCDFLVECLDYDPADALQVVFRWNHNFSLPEETIADCSAYFDLLLTQCEL